MSLFRLNEFFFVPTIVKEKRRGKKKHITCYNVHASTDFSTVDSVPFFELLKFLHMCGTRSKFKS